MIRLAFSMIELIFAIVIIGISVLTIPTMTQVSASSQESSIAQEAVFAGSAKLVQILTYPWSDNSMGLDIVSSVPTFTYILNIGNTDAEVTYNATTNIYGRFPDLNSTKRIGQIAAANFRRSFFVNDDTNNTDDSDGTLATIIGLDEVGGVYDFLNSGTDNEFGYKFTYKNNVLIGFIDDTITQDTSNNNLYSATFSQTGSSNPTNLKVVKLSVTNESTSQVATILYGYASNIGELEQLYSKVIY